jgi:hypothetical protein
MQAVMALSVVSFRETSSWSSTCAADAIG